MSDPRAVLWSTPQMAAIFSAEAHIATILRFEAALAHAEASVGLIPQSAANGIASACHVDHFDTAQLFRDAAAAGTVAIPLVKALTDQVTDEGKDWVHWGATSQDAIDTALMLQMRDGLDLLIAGLHEICARCAELAQHYRATPMAGRTLLQQAVPITFGLKAARWLALVTRQIAALRTVRRDALAIQFGGAVGTLAALGSDGLAVADLLATNLQLPLPDLPWHAERDRIAQIASAVGISAASMSKIGLDLVLLSQSEVGEVAEAPGPGKGGSSAMPHKQNPVDATFALASARPTGGLVASILSGMAQEHERAAGGWQAEWASIPDLFCYTAGSVERIRSALSGLQVNEARLHDNLTNGDSLIMSESLMIALALQIGKSAARQLVTAATGRVGNGYTLREVALADVEIRAVLGEEAITKALDPSQYLGSTDQLIDRALATYQKVLEP